MSNHKILFVHNAPTTFVQHDLQLLRKGYVVQEYYLSSKHIHLQDVWRRVNQSDLVFCWFASWHSFLPVIIANWLGKPAIVVVGGYDTARLPEINYGSQRHVLPRQIIRMIVKRATCLITNSQSARREAIANAKADPEKITVIYHGVSPLPMGPAKRDPMILTVGNVWQENLLRKGLRPFVEAAAYLPDKQFKLVGKWRDNSIAELQAIRTDNVEFLGYVSDKKLTELYQHSAIYVQASKHEGFGLSVAESMLAGCIPVVTKVGALPEVVGECGIYAESTDPQQLATAIEQALNLNGTARQRARARVLTHFSLEQRQTALYKLIDSLICYNEFP